MSSELESHLRDTGLGKKWLVYFNAGKTQLVLFDRSNSNGSIDVKMDGSVLEEKSSLNIFKSSTIRSCMKYCDQVCADALSCYLELLDKLR